MSIPKSAAGVPASFATTPMGQAAARSGAGPARNSKSLTLAATNHEGDRPFLESVTEGDGHQHLHLPRPLGEDERVVAAAVTPETRLLSGTMLWGDSPNDVNIGLLRSHLIREGRLELDTALQLVRSARAVLAAEPNVVRLQAPITVCGDIHGQFYDLINILDQLGAPGGSQPTPEPSCTNSSTSTAPGATAAKAPEPEQVRMTDGSESESDGESATTRQILFLGDYVDRGYFSTEVLLYLVAMKLKYPARVHLLRGNHETRMMTEYMTFKSEVLYKYKSEELYDACVDLFDALPLAAVIGGSDVGDCLAVHGGIGPELYLVSQIEQIDRFREPPLYGPMCDILWSDPLEPPNFRQRNVVRQCTSGVVLDSDDESSCSSSSSSSSSDSDSIGGEDNDGYQNPVIRRRIGEWQKITFVSNTIRQTSFQFGYSAVAPFLKRNRLACVIRAHQVVDEGAKEHFFMSRQEFPLVVTVFTAPNYCDMYGNKGAVLKVLQDDFEYHQFDAVSHPFYLPNFQDLLGFSVPYIMESCLLFLPLSHFFLVFFSPHSHVSCFSLLQSFLFLPTWSWQSRKRTQPAQTQPRWSATRSSRRRCSRCATDCASTSRSASRLRVSSSMLTTVCSIFSCALLSLFHSVHVQQPTMPSSRRLSRWTRKTSSVL